MAIAEMLDATVKSEAIGRCGDLVIERVYDISAIKAEWETLQRQGTSCLYQNFDWVRIAYDTLEVQNEPVVITGHDKGGLKFIIPMVLENGFVKKLRWPGGSHANICSGLFSEEYLKLSPEKQMVKSIFELIGKSINGMAATALSKQPFKLKGYDNPLLVLPFEKSVNLMFEMDLTVGHQAILDMGNGRRRRKLWSKQRRTADEMGGYELYIPKTHDEIRQSLAEFRRHKAARFKEMGIKDVFGDDEAISFLESLALFPQKEDVQLFRIFELRVGGKTRAMYGCGINGDICQACVNSIVQDDFAGHSPNEMIMYVVVQHLCDEGFKTFDLGVGEERYKHNWCQHTHELFDTIVPLSMAATPFVYAMQTQVQIKGKLRRNNFFWKHFKNARKMKAQLLNVKGDKEN